MAATQITATDAWEPTAMQVMEWRERQGLQGVLRYSEARDAIDDARSMHLLAAPTGFGGEVQPVLTPTFKEVWAKLQPVERAIISAQFMEPSRRTHQLDGGEAAATTTPVAHMSDDAIGRIADLVYVELKANGYTGVQGGVWWNKAMYAAGFNAAMLAAAPEFGGVAVALVGERGSVSWRSERILPIGTPLYTHPPAADNPGEVGRGCE